jgi:protein phosphatase
VHGCLEELLELLAALAYRVERRRDDFSVTPPRGRTLAFVGDLVDRGPNAPGVLRLAMSMARAGTALCVAGNRDEELVRALKGRTTQVSRGMALTLDQLAAEPVGFCEEAVRFLSRLPDHLVLDEGRLVVVHMGLGEAMPVDANWAAREQKKALVVHGHTPVVKPQWLDGAVDIDTGCVYGGHLTALRYPERETISIPAKTVYYEPRRPFPMNRVLAKAQK